MKIPERPKPACCQNPQKRGSEVFLCGDCEYCGKNNETQRQTMSDLVLQTLIEVGLSEVLELKFDKNLADNSYLFSLTKKFTAVEMGQDGNDFCKQILAAVFKSPFVQGEIKKRSTGVEDLTKRISELERYQHFFELTKELRNVNNELTQ